MHTACDRRWSRMAAIGLVLAVAGLGKTGLLLAQSPEQPAAGAAAVNFAALRLAIADLQRTFGDRYPHGQRYLERLAQLEQAWQALAADTDHQQPHAGQLLEEIRSFEREALLANPLLDFDRLLLIKRKNDSPALGLPMNWQGNCSLPRTGFDDEIVVLESLRSDAPLATLYKPEKGSFLGDMDLHFDAQRLLFSAIGEDGQWQVFEIGVDGTGLRQVTRFDGEEIDSYDACYLPSGEIIFSSTIGRKGVPCVRGSDHVANLFLMDPRRESIRQLTFDQDHDWCPTVMDNGRVLYLRWEYSDLPHFASRILFQMNPDGTAQEACYGSNSYWPNGMFFARPIPGHPSQFVAVISGHHDVPRMGELIVFDLSKGEREADGVVQRIPGFGKKVEPVLRDDLVKASWPKFLHPCPLSDKYFLVSSKPSPDAAWGIYLVDVFDNMTLIKQLGDSALLEPLPVRPRAKPPVIASALKPDQKDASVYIADIYAGPGLAGIPRQTVKKLRLFTYHFAYYGMGGQIDRVGLDGPWDVKRVLGTVPVESDGSALFRVPANTPISVQPLDAEGKALQLMRSWFVGMPGETVSCNGCHDRQKSSAYDRPTAALSKPPAEIASWYGPTRGFSFDREVQPVLDAHCVNCHDGRAGPGGKPLADLRLRPPVHPAAAEPVYNDNANFSPAYLELRRFVRAPTIESDMHMLTPGDFHADTSRLIQLLRKGHHGVQLDPEAWDRLITWIDLHAPAHGTWQDIVGPERVGRQRDQRRAMLSRYAGIDEDPEAIYPASYVAAAAVQPAAPPAGPPEKIDLPGWPFDADEARRRQGAAGPVRQTIALADGIDLHLMLVPAGSFVLGDSSGQPDEQPLRVVTIDKPFWMGQFEITNEQYRLFDPAHDSRLEQGDFLHFSQEERGYLLNQPGQPVARVSQLAATEFCRWLSEKTGKTFSLPSEQQWEYACRAGTATALSYGSADDDFSAQANLADITLQRIDNYKPWTLPIGAVPPWRPADVRFDDHAHVSAPVGSYRPNAWGLHDMHGNVAEWTTSLEQPGTDNDRVVVRGGSWYERPKDSRSASRGGYRPWQRVFDVGFRVICESQGQQ